MAQMTRSDALHLASALVQDLASRAGARVLFIKGLVANEYGFRQSYLPADIDVLVAPADAERVLDVLGRAGWVARPETTIATAASAHSVALVHPSWPCDLDIHRYFPGFASDPVLVYERLWVRRTEMEFGGMRCAVPDRASAVLITALHCLRHDGLSARALRELQSVTEEVRRWSNPERHDLTTLAEATGSAGPLNGWLSALGMRVDFVPTAALRDWHTRRVAGDVFAGNLIAELAKPGLARRIRLLGLAFWPRSDELRAIYGEPEASSIRVLLLRLARWARGIRQGPAALRAIRQAGLGCGSRSRGS